MPTIDECCYGKEPAQSQLKKLRKTNEMLLEALERVGCQFWACPGPDKPIRHMATCFVCDAIKKGRKAV